MYGELSTKEKKMGIATAIGPTEDQKRVLKNFGRNPDDYTNRPREDVTRLLTELMAQARSEQLTEGRKKALKELGVDPTTVSVEEAKRILTMAGKRNHANPRAQRETYLQQRMAYIGEKKLAVGTVVAHPQRKFPGRITAITPDGYLIIEGVPEKISPKSARVISSSS